MKRKILSILLIITCFFGLTGCTNNSVDKDLENTNQKVELPEEEQIWKDAEANEIYKLRLFLRDSMRTYVDEEIMFYDDVDDLEKLSQTNKFAEKILYLYKNSSIPQILENGTDLEKTLLYTYLGIMTNHYEGMGVYLSKICDEYINLTEYSIHSIYYKGIDETGKFIPGQYSESADYLFIFKKNSENEEVNPYDYIYVFTNGTYDYDNYFEYKNATSSLSMEFYKVGNELTQLLLKKYDGKPANFGNQLNEETQKRIFGENEQFLNFYIEYKNEVFYPKWELENVKPQETKTKPQIGMTKKEVRESLWGSPDDINTDTYSWGTQEQWVYDDYGYVYFENDVVTSVSER